MPIERPSTSRRLFVCLGLTLATGCSDGGTSVEVQVSVTPPSAELRVGTSADLTATVTGAGDSSVTWAADCGTLAGTGNTVTYTAPWGPGMR